MKASALFWGSALGAFALLAAACGSAGAAKAPASPAPLVKTATVSVGAMRDTVLTDGRGFTLYLFKPEKDGMLACLGSCLALWHPLTVPPGASLPATGAGLPGKLATITRPEGSRQATYNEWPLYTFANDRRPGSAAGEGVADSWFVVEAMMPADSDGDGDGTQPPPTPAAVQPSVAPAAPTAAPAPAPPPPAVRPPAFNDGDGDNRGGPSDGDGNG
jgi:predicted lipoprotein with Yx(FWY)xxD motif